MPISTIKYSHATPSANLDYIQDGDKTMDGQLVKSNMDDVKRNYAEEMMENYQMHNKCQDVKSRKYYSIVLSPDPRDNVAPGRILDYGASLAQMWFGNEFQWVCAVHVGEVDKKTGIVQPNHCHITVSSCSTIDGHLINFPDKVWKGMKKDANKVGIEYGMTPIDFTRKKQVRTAASSAEWHNPKYQQARRTVYNAVSEAMGSATSAKDFEDRLSGHGVRVAGMTAKNMTFAVKGEGKGKGGGGGGVPQPKEHKMNSTALGVKFHPIQIATLLSTNGGGSRSVGHTFADMRDRWAKDRIYTELQAAIADYKARIHSAENNEAELQYLSERIETLSTAATTEEQHRKESKGLGL